MKTLLLDTNVVSYLMRGHALGRAYRPLLANHALAVSFMTVAELYEGAYRNNWGTAMRHALDKISPPPLRIAAVRDHSDSRAFTAFRPSDCQVGEAGRRSTRPEFPGLPKRGFCHRSFYTSYKKFKLYLATEAPLE